MALKDVPGQLRAKRFLRRILEKDQAPHALLFTGMAGIGKFALALEFAKALNCLDPGDDRDCCDKCASCKRIEADNHPDFLRITSQGQFIKLDQIRALRDRVRYRPFEGRQRVAILEDAQKLREEAGNALLKILEEPPQQNIFILLALEPQMLLRTIVSRCCHVRCQPLDDQWIEQRLITVHHMPEERARETARLSEGSMARADWWAESERVAHRDDVIGKIRSLRDLPMLDFFLMTTEWAKESEDLELDLEYIKLWIRDLTLDRVMQQGDDAPRRGDPFVESLFSLYQEVESAMRSLRQNANKQLVLEGVCMAIKDNLYG
jgi:DNA polymerase-3 subunit delta'